jgi:hypothetical protein
MQNKANFKKVKFYVNKEMTRDYEKWTLGYAGQNEPKTNPIEANFKRKKQPGWGKKGGCAIALVTVGK